MNESYGYIYSFFYNDDTCGELWADKPLTEKQLIKYLLDNNNFDESVLGDVIVEVKMLLPSYKRMRR